jgi:serine/threonine protein kinase
MSASFDDSTVAYLRGVMQHDAPDHPRYHVGERIGRGGMGAVYLAEDIALRRPVAMKVLREGALDHAAVERMVREAQIIAGLEHPGIVPVHDVGHLSDGRVFYVMKWVNGRRLDECFTESDSIPQRLRVFERVCEAVAFAHAHGVIHRDLKPQNVMVGPFGEVLVLDWGVAKSTALAEPRLSGSGVQEPARPRAQLGTANGSEMASAPQTAHGTILGTPDYMPPEQACGAIDQINERSDVYALGGILYFLLTANAPRANAATESIVPPRQRNRHVARRLQSICLKALRPSPEERYGSAADLAADVSRFLNGQAVSAHKEGLLERVGRWATWYRTPILLVAAYLLVRAILILWQRR